MKTLTVWLAASLLILSGCGNTPKEKAANSIKNLKPRTVYKVITRELLFSFKDEELEQAVFDNIAASLEGDAREMKEKINSLTPGQKAVYVTWIVEAEISDGGLTHYYDNSGVALMPFVKEAFTAIGAPDHGSIMDQANMLYNAIQQDKSKGKGLPYESLENKFEDLSDTESLDDLKVSYIRRNADDFITKQAPTQNQ